VTKTTKKKAAEAVAEPTEVITSYKGFDANWRCRDMQYAVGQTFEHKGEVAACSGGMHACEDPIHTLRYYRPATSKFAVVEQSGTLSRHDEDSKVASSRLTVKVELSLAGLIKAGIEYRLKKCKPADGAVATEKNESATASGDCGAATASGNSGAATASGNSGAATASGYYGAATASGYYGAATASNKLASACAPGRNGRAKGVEGAALFLTFRDSDWNILHAGAFIVGRDGIKADTFYKLDENGNPVAA
jgi:hypothetical protein